MNQLKLLVVILTFCLACEQRSSRQGEFEINLELDAIQYYDNELIFDPVQRFIFKANKDKVTRIPLGNGQPFGVKLEVGSFNDSEDEELKFQLVFMDQNQGEWQVFYSSVAEQLVLNKKNEIDTEAVIEKNKIGAIKGNFSITSVK